jgi:pSer/pThr/pTyr-binding forkhead associated (FHA) protein
MPVASGNIGPCGYRPGTRSCGASNGTWVGGRRVERERRVRSGDQILLGGCLVVVL